MHENLKEADDPLKTGKLTQDQHFIPLEEFSFLFFLRNDISEPGEGHDSW